MSVVTENVHLYDLSHNPSLCFDSDDSSISSDVSSIGSDDLDDPYSMEWETKLMKKYERKCESALKFCAKLEAKRNAENGEYKKFQSESMIELKSGGPFNEFMTHEEFIAIDDALLTNSIQCRMKLESIKKAQVLAFEYIKDLEKNVYLQLQLQYERTLVKLKTFDSKDHIF